MKERDILSTRHLTLYSVTAAAFHCLINFCVICDDSSVVHCFHVFLFCLFVSFLVLLENAGAFCHLADNAGNSQKD